MIKLSSPSVRNLPLVFSVVLNVSLAGVLIERSLPSRSSSASPVPPPTTSAPTVTSTPSQQFHWSEIESADYQTYAQNLRQIGCPDQTIRSIIEAKVADLFTRREQELTGEASPVASSDPSYAQRVQALRQEKAAFLATILPPATSPAANPAGSHSNPGNTGTTPAPAMSSGPARISPPPAALNAPAVGATSTSNSPTSAPSIGSPSVSRMVTGGSDRPSVYPAAMIAPEAGVQMNEAQQAALNQIQNDFNNAVDGAAQNPDDPAYRNNWQNAQWLADQRYRALYGSQAFAEMQKRAYIESLKGSGQ